MLTNGREISLIRNKSGTEFGVCKGFHADQVSNIFSLAHGISHINGKGVVGRVPHNNNVFGSGGSCYRHGKKLVLAAGNASLLYRSVRVVDKKSALYLDGTTLDWQTAITT